MLTRLKVTGFKNLVETEVHFGPFTCIAGFNGVGKSNLFDAIHFLSQLADHTFVDAARRVRGGSDVSQLFTAGGDRRMRFECDLIVPGSGRDDFHQPAEATHTFLTYELELELVEDDRGFERIVLRSERLSYIAQRDVPTRLAFGSQREWRDSVVRKSPRRAPYIEPHVEGDKRVVRLSTDKMRDEAMSKRGGGRPTDFLTHTLPRTVLSAAQNADEARTAVLARAEMRSWRILQLEPSALREPDKLQAPTSLTTEGHHLPATLQRLASGPDGDRALAEISNRVREIREAVTHPHVALVPVRMTEAWFLHDEEAIRRASGNPNGRVSSTYRTREEWSRSPTRSRRSSTRCGRRPSFTVEGSRGSSASSGPCERASERSSATSSRCAPLPRSRGFCESSTSLSRTWASTDRAQRAHTALPLQSQARVHSPRSVLHARGRGASPCTTPSVHLAIRVGMRAAVHGLRDSDSV